jgi:ketosteroid isomerase-like protein
VSEPSLGDRLALRELVDRYALIPDDRDYALIDRVFCEAAVLVGPGFELKGREQIRRGMRTIEKYSATFHAVHNQLLEIDGNEAVGITYCVANHLYDDEGRTMKHDLGIRYHDRYRRGPDGWQIERRELEVVWAQDLPASEPAS